MSASFTIGTIEVAPLRVGLKRPFTIASTTIKQIDNVAVCITLRDGTVGWGEIATLPPVTRCDGAMALAQARQLAGALRGRQMPDFKGFSDILALHGGDFPEIHAAFEMAYLDATAKRQGAAIWQVLGGQAAAVWTDMTIPICDRQEARLLAEMYAFRGFDVLKTKVGLDLDEDVARVLAIKEGHPQCRLVVDANGGFTPRTAIDFICLLEKAGVSVDLFEQPVAREDWDGLKTVSDALDVPVAADESCRSLADVERIAEGALCSVVNIKLAKMGVLQALNIIAFARQAGLKLMLGQMIETRLSTGFAFELAKGLGGFEWIDLDTPLLLSSDPVHGGFYYDGPTLEGDPEYVGHGGSVAQTEKSGLE